MKRVIGKRHSAMAPITLVQSGREDSQFADMEKVFSVASHADALKIFYAAKEGIASSTKAIKELNLTSKRYYTYLKALIDAGLIERDGSTYKHTAMGKICFKLMEAVRSTIGQRDRLDLVDRVSKAKGLSIEETEEIMRAILKDANIAPGGRIADLLGPVRMSDTWEKVVQDVVEYVENAQESILFATQYFDMRVVEAIARAALRGVKMRFLSGGKEVISTNVQLIRTVVSKPQLVKLLFEFANSEDFKLRYIDLPYTFLVIDGRYSMVEITKPFTKTFNLAFFFHNETLSERLVQTFEILWDKASPMSTFIDKLKKL